MYMFMGCYYMVVFVLRPQLYFFEERKRHRCFGLVYNFIQYIWYRNEYVISITKRYQIYTDRLDYNICYPLVNSYKITYTSKDFFKSEITKEILEKKRKEGNEKLKTQKAKELI